MNAYLALHLINMATTIPRINRPRTLFLIKYIKTQIPYIENIKQLYIQFQKIGLQFVQRVSQAMSNAQRISTKEFTHDGNLINQWILENIGLYNELNSFFVGKMNEIIFSFNDFINYLKTQINYMETDLNTQTKQIGVQQRKYLSDLNSVSAAYKILYEICNNLNKLDQNNSKYAKLEKQLQKKLINFRSIDKILIESQTEYNHSLFLLSMEEDRIMAFCELLGNEIYTKISSILHEFSNIVIEFTSSFNSLSKQSNDLDELKHSMKTADPNAEETKKMIETADYSKYWKSEQNHGLIDVMPTLDFDPFSILSPEEVFKDDINATYLVAIRDYNPSSMEEVQLHKNDLLKLTQFHSDDTITVRNLNTGEIGIVFKYMFTAIENSAFILVRKIVKITKHPVRSALALIEQPLTKSILCLEIDGELRSIPEDDISAI